VGAQEAEGAPALPPKPCWLAAGIREGGRQGAGIREGGGGPECAAKEPVRAGEVSAVVSSGVCGHGVGCQECEIAEGRNKGKSAGQQGCRELGMGEAHDGGREGERERERERRERVGVGVGVGVGHARAELTVSLSDVRGSAGKSCVMIPIRRLQIGRKRGLAEAGDGAEGGGGAGEAIADRHHVSHATRDIECKRSRLGGVMSADAERQEEQEQEQEQGRSRNGEGEQMAQVKGFSFLSPKWWSFS
jgi:hypothetical protein